MFGHKFCSLGDMISDERSFRLTTKIELVEVRELTESTDWFLPFHLLHLASRINGLCPVSVPSKRIDSGYPLLTLHWDFTQISGLGVDNFHGKGTWGADKGGDARQEMRILPLV